VIWSDETIVRVGVNPWRQWIIHSKDERLNSKYVSKTFKGECINIMVWTCFTGDWSDARAVSNFLKPNGFMRDMSQED